MTDEKRLGVSEKVGTRLDELVAALSRALGDDLTAFVVHGSAVRGGWREGESDVDAIVVLRDAAPEKLAVIAEPLLAARYAARIEAMILEAGEIPRAADVFPVYYADIQRGHVTLAGTSPFAGLAIGGGHLRLRVEQELREAQIRMRRAFADGLASGGTGWLAGAVTRKVKQLRAPLAALLRLKGGAPGDDLEAVIRASGAAYGVDAEPLLQVAADPKRAHAALSALLAAAVDDADRLEPSS
jgi:predicted nucleotidyltransferase